MILTVDGDRLGADGRSPLHEVETGWVEIVTRGWGLAWGDVVEDGIWVYWGRFGLETEAGRRESGRGCGGGIRHTIAGEQSISGEIQSTEIALRRRRRQGCAPGLEWIGKGRGGGTSGLGCDGGIEEVVWGEVGCQRGTVCERVASASPLLFKAGLEPVGGELEDVLWLNALDVPGQIGYECVKRRHEGLSRLGVIRYRLLSTSAKHVPRTALPLSALNGERLLLFYMDMTEPCPS
jgi:hypothetical protein